MNPLTDTAYSSYAPTSEAEKAAASSPVAPLVHEFEIDGVPCFWTPGHGGMTAGLVFGVGEADEQLHERGLTSLVAELAMRRAGSGTTGQWSVDARHAVLQASGSNVEMQPFLRSLIRSLGSLPAHEIGEASQALVAQSLRCEDPASSEAMSVMYGFEGPGASALPALGLLAADPRSVGGWVRRFFVRENVAAFFYGPRPEGQSFSNLASGQRPERSLAQPPPNRPPTMHRSSCAGPSLFTPIESGRTSAMVVEVARDRIARRLTEVVGHDCAVAATMTEIDVKTAWLALRTSAEESDHQQAFEVIRSELYRLAAEGPGSVEIDRYVETMDERHSGLHSETALAEVRNQAQAFVRGATYVSYPEFRTALATLSPTALSVPLLRAMSTAMWVVPEGSPAQDPDMERESASFRNFPTKSHADPLPDALQFVEGELVLQYLERDRAVQVSHKDALGVTGLPDGTLELHTREGLVLPLDPDAPGAGEPIVSFLAKLPEELLIRVPEKFEFEVIAPVVVRAREAQVVEPVVPESVKPSVEATPAETEQVAPQVEPASPGEQAPVATEVVEPEPEAAVVDESAAAAEEARRKRGFRSKKGDKAASDQGAADVAEVGALAVPGDEVTYCYPSAIQFAEGVVAGAWPLVERLYEQSVESPDTQAHLLHVASRTGGEPSRFDSWVDSSTSPGLPQMIRGAVRLRRAWQEHLIAGPKKSSKEQKRLQEEFEAAEVDLVLSSIELAESPVPWIPLLEATRILGRPRQVAEQRYVAHVERGALLAGHLEFQQYVSKRWFGSHRDMWEHVDYVSRGAEEGSPTLAVAPMAFIEQWLDECLAGTHAANASWMMRQEGLGPILDDAAQRCHGASSFDLLSPASAKALEIFFTFHWSMGDFVSAAALTKRMGKRYSGEPMGYFTKDPWSTIRATAESLAQQAA